MKAGCEIRRILRLGRIVPVDLDVAGRCISARRVVLLVVVLVRVSVIGRVHETSAAIGFGNDCAGAREGVV